MRRVKATIKPDQPKRRYLYVDVSQRGQLRYYVQLRNKLPKIRIKAQFGTSEFETEVDAAISAQIALYGNEGDYIIAQKERNEERPALPKSPAQPGTLRNQWNGESCRVRSEPVARRLYCSLEQRTASERQTGTEW